MTTENRVPRGVPQGGQFAASAKTEAGVSLSGADCPDCYEEHHEGIGTKTLLCPTHENMKCLPFNSSWHTDAPIERMSLGAENRLVSELVRQVRERQVTLDAPYQRGSVWTEDQKIGLVKSMLQGVPVPAIIINDRGSWQWADANGGFPSVDEPWQAVIDGKQRLEAMTDFFDSQFAVPASWFDAEDVTKSMPAADGTQWVTYKHLSKITQSRCENRFNLPVARAQAASVEAEAEMYLLVNGAGTAQSDADLDNAARVASGADH